MFLVLGILALYYTWEDSQPARAPCMCVHIHSQHYFFQNSCTKHNEILLLMFVQKVFVKFIICKKFILAWPGSFARARARALKITNFLIMTPNAPGS